MTILSVIIIYNVYYYGHFRCFDGRRFLTAFNFFPIPRNGGGNSPFSGMSLSLKPGTQWMYDGPDELTVPILPIKPIEPVKNLVRFAHPAVAGE